MYFSKSSYELQQRERAPKRRSQRSALPLAMGDRGVNKAPMLVAAAMLAMAMLPFPQAEAEQPPPQQTSKNMVRSKGGQVRQLTAAEKDLVNYYQKLDKPVQLPDVPEAGSHCKYRSGLEHADGKTGRTNIGLRYGTSSKPQEIVDFYKQGLLASKWKIISASSTSVQARKDDKMLNVIVVPRSTPDVATDFTVGYSYKSR